MHSFTNYVSDNNATCTEDGTKTAKCNGCKKTNTIADPGTAKGHDYVNGVCSVCGDVLAEATGLAYTLSEDGAYYIVSGLGEETRTQFAIPSAYNGLPVKEIGKEAFYEQAEIEKVALPDSIEKIDIRAFKDCPRLQSVSLGRGVRTIENEAFESCENFASITIPDSVSSIGDEAFWFCDNLTSVHYLGTIDQWAEIDFDDYSSNPLYYAHDLYINKELVTVANLTTATKISGYSFYECTSLTSVTIPDGVTSIGDGAFGYCVGLTNITIPDSVTSIGLGSFFRCYRLTNLIIPDSVTSIDLWAFYDSGLTSVTIGSSVTSVGYNAFDGCYKLVEVIDNSRRNITKRDDYDNGHVTSNALSVKKGGTSDIINKDGYLFYTHENNNYLLGYTGKDTSLVLPKDYNGESYEIYKCAFKNYARLTSVTIPDSVTSIGDSAFEGNNLISIIIPDSVTSIGDSAFDSCYRLTSVTIGNNVVSIGVNAFFGSGLTSVTIPSSVTSIDYKAFENCYKLVEVIDNSSLNITKGSFENGFVAYYALNVKKGGASEVVNKDGYLFYTYENVNYLIGYTGTGTDLTLPKDYNGESYEIYEYAFYLRDGLTSVTIPDGVTAIGREAFYDCGLRRVTIGHGVTSIGADAFSNGRMTSIVIPDSVTIVDAFAFFGCYRLTSVYYLGTIDQWVEIEFDDYFSNPLDHAHDLYVNNKLVTVANLTTATKISGFAFYKCYNLTSVTIPDSVTSIGDRAFSGCYNLASVTIPGSVVSIGKFVFADCKSLASITIGNGLTSIGDYAFAGCCMTSLTIPDSVTDIGSYAFSNCKNLTSIIIPDSVTSISIHTFDGCDSLTSVTISDNVTSIGAYAFADCDNLTSINFTGTMAEWDAISKGRYWESGVSEDCVVHCADGDLSS